MSLDEIANFDGFAEANPYQLVFRSFAETQNRGCFE